jgi:two-component system sensor histidine kinase DegS
MKIKHGLDVQLDIRGEPVLQSEALTMFLFRSAQELLFNVVKHAQVHEAAVRVRRLGRYLCLSVRDRGRGFGPRQLKETSGFGLLSIRERVELLGGRMTIKSIKGRGSRFHIIIPDGSLNGQAN